MLMMDRAVLRGYLKGSNAAVRGIHGLVWVSFPLKGNQTN